MRTHLAAFAGFLSLLVVGLTGLAAGAAPSAGHAGGPALRADAADPAVGTWIGPYDKTAENVVRAATFPCFDNPGQTCSGFELVNSVAYRGTVNTVHPDTDPPSLSFSPILAFHANDSDNPCLIPAGTVIARFVFVRTLRDNYPQGARGYQGQLLRATGDGTTCTLAGLAGTYRFTVGSGYDSAGKAGAFFDLRVKDANAGILWDSAGTIVSSGNASFSRKTGTYAPPPATTTTTTTTGTTTTGTTTTATAAVTYIVPAGQTKGESRPTLTGAGRYSYFAPTFDRAAKNNYPNRARLLGEVYLGDGGATATYSIKTLSPAVRKFSLWIYYSDDGLHASGDRAVVISIPELSWSARWSNTSQDTHGWKAVKVGTITTSGKFTISFRKEATTSAAFVMNAFAFTTSAQPPGFGPTTTTGATTAPPSGLWRLSLNKQTYRFVPIKGGFEQRVATTRKSPLGCLIPAGTGTGRYFSSGGDLYRYQYRAFKPGKGGAGPTGKNCTLPWLASKATMKIVIKPTTITVSCIAGDPSKDVCYQGVYARVGP